MSLGLHHPRAVGAWARQEDLLEVEAHATEKRFVAKDDLGQHQQRDEGGKTPEAGDSNRP